MVSQAQKVLDFLEKQDGELFAALLNDFEAISNSLDTDTLAQMIAEGRNSEVLDMVEQAIEDHQNEYPVALTSLFIAAGAFSGSTLFSQDQTFDILDEQNSSYYAPAKAAIVGALIVSLMQTVQTILLTPYSEIITPNSLAFYIKESVGLSPTQWAAVQNYESHLRAGSLRALQNELRDKEADAIIATLFAEKEKLSEEMIRNLVSRYIDNQVQHRAKVIAQTETTRALGSATQLLGEQAVDSGEFAEEQIKRFWHTKADERVRHSHRPIPRMNEKGVGPKEPFQTPLGPLLFPGDPNGSIENTANCRCWVTVQFSEE